MLTSEYLYFNSYPETAGRTGTAGVAAGGASGCFGAGGAMVAAGIFGLAGSGGATGAEFDKGELSGFIAGGVFFFRNPKKISTAASARPQMPEAMSPSAKRIIAAARQRGEQDRRTIRISLLFFIV